jgi:hypothetical protein
MPPDETGTPPAVEIRGGAAQVPAPAPVPAAPADQPMSDAELRDAISSLSSEEARELVAEYTRTYHQPPPAPLVPTTPREASMRLAQLRTDDAWGRKLMDGDIATIEEFHKLSALAASAAPFDPSQDVADCSSGPGPGDHLSRRNMLSAADGLRRDGFNEEAIAHILNDVSSQQRQLSTRNTGCRGWKETEPAISRPAAKS